MRSEFYYCFKAWLVSLVLQLLVIINQPITTNTLTISHIFAIGYDFGLDLGPGWLYDMTNSYDPGFHLAGAAIAISGLMLFAIPSVDECTHEAETPTHALPPSPATVVDSSNRRRPSLGGSGGDAVGSRPTSLIVSSNQVIDAWLVTICHYDSFDDIKWNSNTNDEIKCVWMCNLMVAKLFDANHN